MNFYISALTPLAATTMALLSDMRENAKEHIHNIRGADFIRCCTDKCVVSHSPK